MISLFDTLIPAGRFPVTGADNISVTQDFDNLQNLLDYLLSEIQTINDRLSSGDVPVDPPVDPPVDHPTDPDAAVVVSDINNMLVSVFEMKTVLEVEA